MGNLKAVIFDYYETLAELTPAQRVAVFDDLARRVGAAFAPGEAYRHWRQRTTRDTTLRLRAHDRPPLDGALLPFRSFRDVWQRRFGELFSGWSVEADASVGTEAYAAAHTNAPAYPEVSAALDALRGRYRLAVFSDADHDFLHASVERNGFGFEAVMSSEEVGAYKPHVSVFRAVCSRLGVEPAEAAYVGDTPYQDVEGARHAGLRAIWLDRHEREWPGDLEPPRERIGSLAELAELLS